MIAIVDILPPVTLADFQDVYVISELMDTDLHQIIISNQPLSNDHMQYFVYQMLRGLKYIHSLDVVRPLPCLCSLASRRTQAHSHPVVCACAMVPSHAAA